MVFEEESKIESEQPSEIVRVPLPMHEFVHIASTDSH